MQALLTGIRLASAAKQRWLVPTSAATNWNIYVIQAHLSQYCILPTKNVTAYGVCWDIKFLVMQALLTGVKLGSAVQQPWLVTNSAAAMWTSM